MDTGIERNPEDPYARPAPPSAGGEPENEREAVARLDEIRQYLSDRYGRRDVVATTTTTSGQRLDWVPVESQVDGPVALPPDTAPEAGSPDPDRVATSIPFELASDGVETGPPGTVPLARKRIDDIRATVDLQDWLAKGPRRNRQAPPDAVPFPVADDPVHKYAHAYQFVPCFGTEGVINTWRPYVQWSNEFSLGQLWLVRGGGDGLQTVEVGAQTIKDLYGDWEPHLFIFFTTNNYTHMGDNLGGYNADVDGFVQVSSTVYPTMSLAQSVAGGNQYELALKVQLSAGNWWVRVGDQWMGYYPATLYSPAGLRDQADKVDWGGEIVDDVAHHPEVTSTWMGSGNFASAGWQWAAYMRNLNHQSDQAGSMAPMQGFTSVTHPASYTIAADFSGASTWGSNFFWGGPGGI
jgi:hypothetical protein